MSSIKKNIVLVAAFLFFASCSEIKTYQGERQIVAVMPFVNLTERKISKNFLEGITDQYIAGLIKTGRFGVVERSRIQEIIKEHRLGLTGLMKTNEAISLGQFLQAPYIILNSISAFNVEKSRIGDININFNVTRVFITLNSRVIQTGTGAAVGAATQELVFRTNQFKIAIDDKDSLINLGDEKTVDSSVAENINDAIKRLTVEIYSQKF
ncbi:MAG: CsgG/HfaB family protein [Spirochaetes bacterium]|jgi:curli biogenesis system outer membrane secretion channel CsgG|nr:CsgG/HfaB family protein [Spirochaetota bacterium]